MVPNIGVDRVAHEPGRSVQHQHVHAAGMQAVGRMKIWGDRDGSDAGIYTRVMVDFDYDLRVVMRDGTSNFALVQFPRTVSFTPRHTEGDREFNGHGPAVKVSVFLTKSPNQVVFNVYMKARETRSDWTTAEGYKSMTIYTAPPGRRIKRVIGKQRWDNVVSYVDDDHDWDTFYNKELGYISVKGDEFSDLDAGLRTHVKFANIDHRVIVELEPN